jgi:hypothetical protein
MITVSPIRVLIVHLSDDRYLNARKNSHGQPISWTYTCAQREDRKRTPKKTDDEKKQRDKPQMDVFPCEGRLWISISPGSSGNACAEIKLEHKMDHLKYQNVQIPDDVKEFIKLNCKRRVPEVQSLQII